MTAEVTTALRSDARSVWSCAQSWNAMTSIESPCIKVCILDSGGAHCIGCGRSLAEIAGWIAFTEAERAAVIADLPRRLVIARDALARAGVQA